MAQAIFATVSHVRANPRGLRENLNHKILTCISSISSKMTSASDFLVAFPELDEGLSRLLASYCQRLNMLWACCLSTRPFNRIIYLRVLTTKLLGDRDLKGCAFCLHMFSSQYYTFLIRK